MSFKSHVENEAGRLASDLPLFFKMIYMRQKQVICIVERYFDIPRLAIQSKLYKTLGY